MLKRRKIGISLSTVGLVGCYAVASFAQGEAPAPTDPPPTEGAATEEPPPAGTTELEATPGEATAEADATAAAGQTASSTEATPDDPASRMPPTLFGPVEEGKEEEDEARRARPLRTTVGVEPTRPDFGSEADLVSTVNVERPPAFTKKWSYSLGAFLRAPMRIGYGPRNDGTDGDELHSPPRIAGASKYSFAYTGLAPNPTASLYITVENSRVSGNVILTADTFYDAGYDHLDEIGGIAQAYVTLKFPEAFDNAGGMAWTVGAFSNRYGMAGPNQQSAGYYETYLFGRTHTAGEALTANFDLNDDVEITIEHGFGTKLEPVPFDTAPPQAPYLPQQGPVPQGSNFVHHAHASAAFGGWLTIGAHYLNSWSPNDRIINATQESLEADLKVFGGEVHVDTKSAGNAYLGFAQVIARDVLPLADGVELLHSKNGWGLKENYFGTLAEEYYSGGMLPDADDDGYADAEDDGSLQALLFQYIVRLRPLLGLDGDGRDLALALFGMFVNAHAEEQNRDQTKIKAGAELSFNVTKNLSAGFRYDQVMDDGSNADYQHSVITPKLVLHSKWISREYIVLSYSRYFLGSAVEPTTFYDHPYRVLNGAPAVVPEADENMVALTAIVSF